MSTTLIINGKVISSTGVVAQDVLITDEQITALLSKQYGVPAINLAQFKIDLTIV